MNRQAIGVFDSGAGGLSVLKQIRQLLPDEELIYVADSGAAPYGDKSPDYIAQRSLIVTDYLLKQQVKAIVVACNTATSFAIESLRQHCTIPIIGIEPAVKPALELSQTGVVGVLATTGTLTSERFYSLLNRYQQNDTAIIQACPGLVEQVESGNIYSEDLFQLLSTYLLPLMKKHVDTYVLGCTHYPFLIPVMRKIVGEEAHIIDPSPAVARELQRQLMNRGILVKEGGAATEQFITTGDVQLVQPILSKLWGADISVRQIAL